MASRATFLPTLVGYAVALAASFFLVAYAGEDGAAPRANEPMAGVSDGSAAQGAPT